ncbi:MAG: glycosyltransferase family 2 protein [Anaerolineae bacterium]|jgi:glycosyltransferase involved in cell wall biosynthesis
MRVALIIPALNEEASLSHVLPGVPRDLVDQVIVVDNGSTDRTGEVARSAGARVVREERRGYGYACAAGVAAAGDAADALLFMDGDGSDDAGQIRALIAPLERGEADLVLGSRVLGARLLGASDAPGALLPHQRLGNALTTALIRLLYRQQLTDLPPLKGIRRTLLDSLYMREMTYGWTVEMIVKCARRKCRIVEVPVTVRPRIAGRSKVSGTIKGTVLAAYYLLGTTIRYAWRE